MIVRAAAYIRVSTADQKTALQVDAINKLVAAREWELHHTYTDHGMSGAKRDRPQLQAMMKDAHRGEFNVVVVFKADRIFRSLRDLLSTVDVLDSINVGFVSCTETFDTSSAQGKLMLSLMGAFSEFERGLIRERTKAGIAAARRRGAKIGRPRVEIDLARAIALRREGMSFRRIAKELGASVGKVHRALSECALERPGVFE